MSETQAVGDEGSWVVGSILRALEMGLADHACEVYEESGAEAANEILGAIKAAGPEVCACGALMFSQARDFSRSARLHDFLRDYASAAAQYEAAGEMEYAGKCYERLGDSRRAAASYDAAGSLDKASALYSKLGDKQDVARVLMRANRGLEAAKIYRELGNARGELDALRAVRGDSPERAAATRRLMELLVAKSRAPEATQIAADAIRESAACRRDAGILESLAELYEQQGQHEQASRVRVRLSELGTLPEGAAAPARPAAAPAARPAASATPAAAIPPHAAHPAAARPIGAPVSAARPAPRAPSASAAITTEVAPRDGGYSFLKAIPLFAKLTLDDMKDLYRLTTEVSFTAGEVMIEQGTDGRGLFVVVEGHLEIVLVQPTGTKKLNTLGPGAYVGEVSLLGRSRTSARVAAVGRVQALHIPPEQFEHFLNGKPAAALRVYRLFAENLAERVRALSSR